MGRISALTELTSLASNDYLIVLDSSANIAKKISVANAFGVPETTWTASGETWTFSSWNSTTRIGVVTVPSDATTKYQAGNRIKISQTTGGTKYGIIHAVTSTTLSIFFPTGTTLNNETINTPFWSALDSPKGFDKDPDLWTVVTRKTTRTTQSSVSLNTWYNVGGSLTVGIGEWLLSAGDLGLMTHSSMGYAGFTSALGTASNGSLIADTRYRSAIVQAATSQIDDQYVVANIPFTVTGSSSTVYLLRATGNGTGITLYSEATTNAHSNADNFIKALSAYL